MKAAYLVGFRGAGKTSLGRLLCRDERWEFLDLDEEWEKARGSSISSFVDRHGLEAFRREEYDHLAMAEKRSLAGGSKGLLIATGGGVVDWEPSLQFLLRSPVPKIYLHVEAEELWRRLESSPERRKIGGLNSLSDLEDLWRQRVPRYEKIATYRLENRDITQCLTGLRQLLGLGPFGA